MSQSSRTTQEAVLLLLERLAARDARGIAELFAERIDWYVGGNPELPWTGRRDRREDVVTYFESLWAHLAEGQSSTDPGAIVVDGQNAVVLATFRHTAASTGVPFVTPVALHVVVQEGRLTTLHLYEDTYVVDKAFFPGDS